jgi:hypothetical protein
MQLLLWVTDPLETALASASAPGCPPGPPPLDAVEADDAALRPRPPAPASAQPAPRRDRWTWSAQRGAMRRQLAQAERSLWDVAPEPESEPESPDQSVQRCAARRSAPLFDPALAKSTCPGCVHSPARTCAVCERPAMIAVLLDEYDHSCSYCRQHWAELQQARARKAQPLVTVPVRQGHVRRRSGVPGAGVPLPHGDEAPPMPVLVGDESLAVAIA